MLPFHIIAGSIGILSGAVALYAVKGATLHRRSGMIFVCAMLVALAVGVTHVSFGVEASSSAEGTKYGYPLPLFFIFGPLALLAAFGDLRMLRAGGVQRARRIARYLWRMCFALFIASASFFLGQAMAIPVPLRIYPVLIALALLSLVLMLYWLVRVRRTPRHSAAAFT